MFFSTLPNKGLHKNYFTAPYYPKNQIKPEKNEAVFENRSRELASIFLLHFVIDHHLEEGRQWAGSWQQHQTTGWQWRRHDNKLI